MMQRNDVTGKPIRLVRDGRLSGAMCAARDACAVDLSLQGAENTPWIVLRTETGREKAVEKSLCDVGATALVPMRKGPERRRHHKVLPPQDVPLMTGYVLLRVLYTDRIGQALAGVRYVLGVLGAVGRPHQVSHASVCALIDKSVSGTYDWQRPSAVSFSDGEAVRIADGVFAGFIGHVVGRHGVGHGDAVVELNMFGRMQPVMLPLVSLEKI